ncbi:MAG: c-type cytochrome [Planctomycetales bacterium]
MVNHLRRDLGRWVVWGSVLALAGCQAEPPAPLASSAQVQRLPPELQAEIGRLLEEYCGTAESPKLLGDDSTSIEHLRRGRRVYLQRCWHCHGGAGDGAGPAADWLYPRPRDYRRGVFKFTSTPYGGKPRRDDLLRTIRVGSPGTSMPSFNLLPAQDLEAVVDYVLVLTHRGELEFQFAAEADAAEELPRETAAELVQEVLDTWKEAQDNVVQPLTPEPRLTAEHVQAGREAFLSKGCSKCHGDDGRGQTADNWRGDLKDVWGFTTRAADLTSGMLHGGHEPLDIYRRISSGINGTPMPAFRNALENEPETLWNLTSYVLYVSNRRRAGTIPEAGLLKVSPQPVGEGASGK